MRDEFSSWYIPHMKGHRNYLDCRVKNSFFAAVILFLGQQYNIVVSSDLKEWAGYK